MPPDMGRLPDGAPSPNVRVLAPRAFELHLLSLQLESRQFLEEKLKDHATPGGMTEKAVKEFKRLWEEVQGRRPWMPDTPKGQWVHGL